MTPQPELSLMPTHNPENERIKRRYFAYLKEAKRRGEPSVDAAAKALSRFELDTGFRAFNKFHPEQAVAFKRRLAEQTNARTGKPLAKATIHSTLAALKAFFVWLAGEPGFRSRLSFSDADYFNLSDRDARIARTRLDKPFPSLEQVQHVIRTMPANDPIQLRDRALVAFILLTGARDGAVKSLKLKHLDLSEGCLIHDAREVTTKFGKSFATTFFPVGADARRIVEEWVGFLTKEMHWAPTDPLFPATLVDGGAGNAFHVAGLRREHWTTADPIRKVFKRAFAAAGLPYYSPHRLRDTIVSLGKRNCRTMEEFQAWGQNLGHNNVTTTFGSYGAVSGARQAEIIRGIAVGASPPAQVLNEMAALLAKFRGRPVLS
jgi:integrase/recombinase XerD